MFNQDKETKLDWMYKGANSMVDREEYLLGRKVDKTLEEINTEEKQEQLGGILPPKNRVEHECIPPSIRDFNKVVQSEQVDLSAKLQEDPLVAIKKREEDTRRQFLQNPIQLKKLQKALKAQEKKKRKKKKKHSKKVDYESDDDLDTILMHKFNQFKHELTEQDIRDVLNVEENDSNSEDENVKRRKNKKRYSSDSEDNDSSSDDERYRHKVKHNKNYNSSRHHSRDYKKHDERRKVDEKKHKNERDNYESSRNKPTLYSNSKYNNRDSDVSDSPSSKRQQNWGLMRSDGSKIPLNKTKPLEKFDKPKQPVELAKNTNVRNKSKKLTEDEKEKLRMEMMENAAWRNKEKEDKFKRRREKEEMESKMKMEYDPNFIHKQLLKSVDSYSVESRIKSNVNNIQRGGGDMNVHFSRR